MKDLKPLEQDVQESKIAAAGGQEEEFSLNDDRRVKVLSPNAMVLQRFFRNRLAVLGLIMLLVMFVFSFIGGVISPYREDEQFYRYEDQMKEYVGVVRNNDFRYTVADGQKFDTIMQAEFQLAVNEERDNFDHKGTTYDVMKEGEDYYSISANGTMLAIAAKDIVNVEGAEIPFDVKYEALKAYTNEVESFAVNGKEYGVDEDGNILDGETVLGYISRFVVSSASADVVPGRVFKEELEIAIDNDEEEFTFTGEDGVENSTRFLMIPRR